MEFFLAKGAITDQKVNVIVNYVLSDVRLTAPDKRPDFIHRVGSMEYCPRLLAWSEQAKDMIGTSITKCLERTEANNLSSVAFPTHAMAQLQYPATDVAEIVFKTIIEFAKRNPRHVKKVVLVVLDSDMDFIKAFQNERLKHLFDTNIQLNSKLDHTIVPPEHAYHGFPRLGVSYVEGSIVEQNADVIVNSTNTTLNLTEGDISQAILSAAGPDIVKECQRYSNGINDWGIAVTSGGKINCKKIYHTSLVQAPWFSIEQIERVQNKTVYDQYCIMKRRFDEKNPTLQNERKLWHGTSSDSTNSINTYGFNRSYCGKNATVYGKGAYFATESSYSAGDTYSPPDSEG
ncbi:protein mono-ADP-ribosyltransferase PARP14-like [Gigantopelta aegis]|uniref:protein mono-ADP-ribosyltransferase PARP14-like n=1 Tax=Gigantopelta aegis TaxID=1735272 RepID=UPI001B88D040|nr:protein mono-ADP-ribosyltransferase PARP14-like [Gigantopelta aegis]